MKRVLLLAAILCVPAMEASADYIDPPGWNNNPYFTHQSWSFDQDENPALPDDGYINPYGTPLAMSLAGDWQGDLGWEYDDDGNPVRQRQGGWRFEGPLDEVISVIDIPNIAVENLTKELWLQVTLKTNSAQPMVWFEAFDDQGNPFDLSTTPTIDFLGEEDPVDGGVWARATFQYEIFPQPDSEYLRFTARLLGERPGDGADEVLPAEFFIVDQIDVDTRCVPEPSTLVMLAGLGLLAMVMFATGRRVARR